MCTTVKVKFRQSAVAGYPGSIVYFVTRHRIVRQIATNYKVFPSIWDEIRSKAVTNSNEKLSSIAQLVYRDTERLNKIIRDLDSLGRDYSSDDVFAEFMRVAEDNMFFGFMECVILRLHQLNHIGTANNYRAALNSFKRFREGEDVLIDATDHILIEDYQAYLKAMGLTPNSISFYMRILRAVYNRAVNQELTRDRRPFRYAFTGTEKTLKRAISLRDVKRIKYLDLSKKPSLMFARDIFLFLFFCRGMSFIDAAFLKKTDIRNGMLIYRRHKTNQLLHVKVVKQISEIIERYSIRCSPNLLPIIAHPGTDERRQYESALRRINNALKETGRLVKLPIPLTTYVARHAWATIARQKNVPVPVISDALGHDSEATTQIYLASIDTSTIDRANDLIIKDL